MSFLGTLNEQDQRALRAVGQWRRWRRGATLFFEGDHSDTVLVLEIGRVKLVRTDETGEDDVLAIFGKGDLLGELAALDGKPRSATAVALDDVEAFVIPADAFRAAMVRQPAVASALLSTVSERLRTAGEARVEMARADTQRRVARRLVELAERFGEEDGDAIRIDLSLSQEELAGWAGASREAVVKALKTMRDRGMIETKRREIIVLDLDRLTTAAR